MNIAFGCDHAGFKFKNDVIDFLKDMGHNVIDFGCHDSESCDYPDFGSAVSNSVAGGECSMGILLCGTGVGMSIVANKTAGIRAAVCWNNDTAKLSREHNDANVLCLPARFASIEEMTQWIDTWLLTPFSGQERHIKRLKKIMSIEKNMCGSSK